MAGAKGLEPSAFCVTGRRYNQLNYAPINAKLLSEYRNDVHFRQEKISIFRAITIKSPVKRPLDHLGGTFLPSIMPILEVTTDPKKILKIMAQLTCPIWYGAKDA